MNDFDKKKYLDIINRNRSFNDGKKKSCFLFIRKVCIRVFIVGILFLSLAIVCKESDVVKEKVVNYLYSEDISFTKFKKLYNKYLGGILPIKNDIDTEKVFNESLKYTDCSIYLDGVKLEVSSNYLVPALREGMVVFVGDKEGYGSVIIIEDLDGVYNWYGNISSTSLKLYDYVERGSLVGEVSDNLYLVFSKGDTFLNYEEYIK